MKISPSMIYNFVGSQSNPPTTWIYCDNILILKWQQGYTWKD